MLTYEQLKKYYSDGLAAKMPKNILVEYLQYELLDSLFKQKRSELLVFIGGTAIRIIYGSSRFSEDLDFDNFGLPFDEFEEIVDNAGKDLELKGFSAELRFVEKGAYHCYLKFPEILYDNNLSSLLQEKVLIRLDTVNKEPSYRPVIHTLNKFDVFRNILAAPADIILAQKLITIMERKREKGRDFYDASFLLGLTKPDFLYIKKTTGLAQDEFGGKFLERLNQLDFNFLAKDVEPFLAAPEQSERIKNFKDFVVPRLR
ncbi:MAG: nucleotidyl transferase AbiEii/AbiGii toxin family protein [Patescibacteria group bacterium]